MIAILSEVKKQVEAMAGSFDNEERYVVQISVLSKVKELIDEYIPLETKLIKEVEDLNNKRYNCHDMIYQKWVLYNRPIPENWQLFISENDL